MAYSIVVEEVCTILHLPNFLASDLGSVENIGNVPDGKTPHVCTSEAKRIKLKTTWNYPYTLNIS